MRGWSFGLSVLVLQVGSVVVGPLALGSCASRPAAPEPAAAPTPPAPVELPAFPAVDAPEDVMLWARLAAPARDLPVLAAFGMMPEDVAGGLAHPKKSIELLLGPELAGAVDLDAPVDVLFPDREREQEWTLGFTAHPEAPTRNTDLDLTRIGAERWRIGAPGANSGLIETCELWRGAPPSGDRILCSTSAQRLASDAPFLMGTAPRHASTASLRIAIPGPGYRHGLRQVMRGIEEDAADSTEAMGTRLVADTVAEHDGIALDLTFGETAVEVGLEVGFSSSQTPFNTWLAGETTGPGVLPGFWKLPASADLAFSKGRIGGRALRGSATPMLEDLLRLSVEDLEVSVADREEIERAIVALAPTGGAFSFATGRAPDERARWYLVGIEQDATEYTAAVRELVRQAKREFPVRKGATKDDAPPEPTLTEISLVSESPASLPQGSLHLLLGERAHPDAVASADDVSHEPATDSHVHVFVVPDAQRVWLAWAADDATALARARGVLRGDHRTLHAVQELADRSERAEVGIGFTTLRGVIGLTADDHAPRIAALPNRGATPIPLWFQRRTEGAGDSRGITLRLAGSLHPDVVMDAMAWMLLAFGADEVSE